MSASIPSGGSRDARQPDESNLKPQRQRQHHESNLKPQGQRQHHESNLKASNANPAPQRHEDGR